MSNLIITCQNCGQQFVWTQQEQDRDNQANKPQPTLCLICRSIVKTASKDRFRGSAQFGKEKPEDTE